MEGDQDSRRRLVRVRKRKVLSDLSNPVTDSDQENTSQTPKIKRIKRHLEVSPPRSSSSEPTLDWGLKTKARFISPHSFDWVRVKKAKQESQGIAAFVQGQTTSLGLDPVSELQSHLMYWEHPSIPSLSLFSNNKLKTSLVALKETTFIDSLKEDWSTSFRSVFQLFRLGTCPHFYLCAYHFTILFLSLDSGSMAVISPSTSGFRKALKREGVQFSLPLDRPVESGDTVEEPQDSESDDECSSWLTSMIGANEGKALSNKINTRPVCHQSIDSRPESTLIVESSSLQSLFNYLLNCKTLIAPTGPQAGLPPTVLSPVAFEGGTLRALKVSVGSMSEQSGRGLIRKHYLDIIGPILPQTLKSLHKILTRTQQEFKVHTVASEFTSVFSSTIQQNSTNS